MRLKSTACYSDFIGFHEIFITLHIFCILIPPLFHFSGRLCLHLSGSNIHKISVSIIDDICVTDIALILVETVTIHVTATVTVTAVMAEIE